MEQGYIGLADLLTLMGRTKNDFDGAKTNEVLPYDLMARYGFADGRTRAKFTEWEAVQGKTFFDATRFGLKGREARNWLSSSVGYIRRGWFRSVDGTVEGERLELAPPRDPMTWQGDDLFICREAYTASYVKTLVEDDAKFRARQAARGKPVDDDDFNTDPEFSIRCWGGTEAQIRSQIAYENSDDPASGRESLSLHFYNLSKAVRIVRDRAEKMGLHEAEDFNTVEPR